MVENMGQDAAVDVISWTARVKDVAAGQYNTVCIVCQSHDPHKYIFPQASSHTICTCCVINTKDVTPAVAMTEFTLAPLQVVLPPYVYE